MSLVPRGKTARIGFFRSKIALWTANAVQLNVDPTAVTDLSTKADAALDLWNSYETARDAAKTALDAYDAKVEEMSVAGAKLISQIRTTAKTEGESTWQLAGLPVPTPPAPRPAPGLPHNFSVELGQNGVLELKWKCTSPGGGVVYHIYRRDEPTGPYYFLGGSSQRKYIDATIPAGASQITYELQGVSPRGVGPVAQCNVNFGVNAGGGMTASVAQPPRIAA